MNTKLTLTLNPSVIEKAKKFAKENNSSLSKIVENHFNTLTEKLQQQHESPFELPDRLKALKGSVKAPKDFDYKTSLHEALEEKYLK